jgi:hypothetical protein
VHTTRFRRCSPRTWEVGAAAAFQTVRVAQAIPEGPAGKAAVRVVDLDTVEALDMAAGRDMAGRADLDTGMGTKLMGINRASTAIEA